MQESQKKELPNINEVRPGIVIDNNLEVPPRFLPELTPVSKEQKNPSFVDSQTKKSRKKKGENKTVKIQDLKESIEIEEDSE